jgi:hypothetical protein
LLDEVFTIDGLPSSAEVDAIGNEVRNSHDETTDTRENTGFGWYSKDGSPPTFSTVTKTFVVKTAEGNYGKFQIGSFYGPAKEAFYAQFRYYYAEDTSGTFGK